MTQRLCAGIVSLFLLATAVGAQSQQAEQSQSSESTAQSVSESASGLETDGAAAQIAQVDETLLPIGDDQGAVDDGSERQRAIGFGDVLRMLLVLGAVIGVIYLTFKLLKRASNAQIQSSTIIHNVSTVPLGGNKALHVIRIGQRHYLIGSAEHNVRLIETIEDQETIDFINHNKTGDAAVGKGAFRSRIRALLGAISKPSATVAPKASDIVGRISPNHRRLKGI